MANAPKEPLWLTLDMVIAIHEALLAQHGGLPGLRDAGLLASALDRPQNRWAYGEERDLCVLAAADGFGLAKNHAFKDGSKRTAFQAMFAFLYVNGLRLVAQEPEAVLTMVRLAAGRLSEPKLGAWLRENTTPR